MTTARWLLLLVTLASCKRIASGAIDGGLAPSASIYAIESFKAKAGGEEEVAIVIAIRADGALSFDGLALKDDNELAARARDAVGKSRNLRAVIDADQTVPFGRVITVLDTLKRSGVSRISFGTAGLPRLEP